MNKKHVARILASIKRDGIAMNWEMVDEEGNPSLQVTLGANDKGQWAIQTGDNSYVGVAHGYPYWGVAYLYPGCSCQGIADYLVGQVKDQMEN